jgi:transcriptional antiterminator NusG
MMHLLKIGDFVGMVDLPIREAKLEPKRWYLLRVHPNRELGVVDRLLDRGVMAYVPRESWSKRTVWSRQRIAKLPIFPGIAFIADFDANLRRLRDLADGIVGFVTFGERVAYAGEQVMASIHRLEERLNLPLGQRRYAVNQEVRVIRGPFDMWEGRIERLDSHGRLRVLLDVLGRQVPIELDETQIEPV